MSKSQYQQTRIFLTRLLAIIAVFVLITTGSKWETNFELLSGIFFSLGCFLVAIASLGRLWCSLYIAGKKTKNLVTEGPYSISRNPLYFFSFLGAAGIGAATETLTIPIIIMLCFGLYYPFVIRYEENKLKSLYGKEYEQYLAAVPRFFPRWSLLKEPDEYLVSPKIFKKHIFSAMWFIWLIGIIEMIEILREIGALKIYFYLY